MKKILVVYAPYGSGHKSIAQVIANGFLNNKEYEIKVLDIAKYANFIGKKTIKAFDLVIKYRTSHLFSFLYDIADNKLASLNQMQIVKKCFDNKNIRREIVDFNPDLTISTHFYGGNIISYYNKLGLTNSKIMTVITDYKSHSFWRKDHVNCDAYIVGNEIVKSELSSHGINPNKIYAYGLPFDRKKLLNLKSRDEILSLYDLDKMRKTFLFFGGGSSGSINNYEYLKILIKCNYPINIIFISGKNENLENKCRSYVVKHNIKNVKILGFTNMVYSLINASDVVITKPGGATITECMDMHRPMILIPGNGGPEKYNAKFIVKNKYGIKANNIVMLCKKVKYLVNNPKQIEYYHDNLLKISKNESTKKIIELSEKLLKL